MLLWRMNATLIECRVVIGDGTDDIEGNNGST